MLKNKTVTPTNSDSIKVPRVQRVSDFVQFAQWYATPRESREYKTQKDLANSIGVCQDTLSDWKKRPEFWPLAQDLMGNWIKERIPDVINGLYSKACNKGNAKEVEMFLRLAGMQFNKPNNKNICIKTK